MQQNGLRIAGGIEVGDADAAKAITVQRDPSKSGGVEAVITGRLNSLTGRRVFGECAVGEKLGSGGGI